MARHKGFLILQWNIITLRDIPYPLATASLRLEFLFIALPDSFNSRRHAETSPSSLLNRCAYHFQTFPSSETVTHHRSGSITNLAKGLTVFARIRSMSWEKMKSMVEIEGFEHIEEAFKQKNGTITFTAHYGCWELMAIYVTHLYPDIAMVVRPLDNPLL